MPAGIRMPEESQPEPDATAHAVFEAILAGATSEDVQPMVRRLPPEEFRTLMCTFCLMHKEIEGMCTDRATQIGALLQAHCRYFAHGERTCAPEEHAWLFPVL